MSTRMDDLLARMRTLQDELEEEIAEKRVAFRYKLENGRIVWEEEARRQHRALRIRWLRFLAYTRPMVLLTAPFIYSLIIPFVLLHLFVIIYQAACFPVYGIPKVPQGGAGPLASQGEHIKIPGPVLLGYQGGQLRSRRDFI